MNSIGYKARYYLEHGLKYLVPKSLYRAHYRRVLLDRLRAECTSEMTARVEYYNKMTESFVASQATVGGFTDFGRSTYFFDLERLLKYFPRDARFNYQFGDTRDVPSRPTLVKARPIVSGNENAVLLKLNVIRHFRFFHDSLPFREKSDTAVWRGGAYLEPRLSFVRSCHALPRTDIGQTNDLGRELPPPRRPLTIEEQMRHKFIISVEGNDVATNLKWILHSNSLCMMTHPRHETWFMEGRLVPGRHFVLLRDDYSDLEEKIDHYAARPAEAEAIIREANAHTRQFLEPQKEFAISLLVLQKYFALQTGAAG